MKRRHALITSATVSVVVLGGAVAAAAWSGNGLLGFRHSDPSGATSAASDGAPADSVVTVASPAPQAPGTTVQVRVVEDRIVVRSGGTTTGGESVLGRLSAADAGSEAVPSEPESSTTAPPASTTSTTVRARPRDDDDDDDHDEYEHEDHDDEHEHGEYEDD